MNAKADQEKLVSPAASKAPSAYPVHPALFAVFFVLVLFSANMDETPLSDLPVPLLGAVCLSLLTLLLARPLFRSWSRASLAATWFVLFFFCYGHAHSLVGAETVGTMAFTLIWGVLFLAGFVAIRVIHYNPARLLGAANKVAAICVLTSLTAILLAVTRLPASAPDPSDENNTGQFRVERGSEPRDIYYLVFDRYASLDVLLDQYAYDNSPFYGELSRRGFHCYPAARTNYPKTVIQMDAVLNMRYQEEQLLMMVDYASRLQENRFASRLQNIGYQYHFYGNWYNPLRKQRSADYNFPLSWLPSEFAEALVETTPLAPIRRLGVAEQLWAVGGSPQLIRRQFDTLERNITTKPGPKFVYAHFLLPHSPYFFNADGSIASAEDQKTRSMKAKHLEQIGFANRRILSFVDKLLDHAPRKPIIVLQADEGPLLDTSDSRRPRKEQLMKRCGILSALFLPGIEEPPPSITPVNTFRYILRQYFESDIPLLPDRTFFWEIPSSRGLPAKVSRNHFIDVTDLVNQK